MDQKNLIVSSSQECIRSTAKGPQSKKIKQNPPKSIRDENSYEYEVFNSKSIDPSTLEFVQPNLVQSTALSKTGKFLSTRQTEQFRHLPERNRMQSMKSNNVSDQQSNKNSTFIEKDIKFKTLQQQEQVGCCICFWKQNK